MKKDLVGLIPAAGVGTRLYPFSRAVPKELYPILGKATIEHCVETLREGGIRKIYIVVGYQKGAIMDYLGNGSDFGVNLAYIYQMRRGGIGHAILQAKEWIDSTFVALLGDSFIEPKEEIRKLVELHKRKHPVATLLLFKVTNPSAYGVARLRKEGKYLRIERLVEKPSLELAREFEVEGQYYALCGAYVLEPEIFDFIARTPPGKRGEIEITDALQLAIEEGESILGWELKGKYMDVGKWETALQVEKEMFEKHDAKYHAKERTKFAEKITHSCFTSIKASPIKQYNFKEGQI
ncbi:MAG: sugar phosphate nucleotidyltransferase [Candidatus Hadarchaeales archaeon]